MINILSKRLRVASVSSYNLCFHFDLIDDERKGRFFRFRKVGTVKSDFQVRKTNKSLPFLGFAPSLFFQTCLLKTFAWPYIQDCGVPMAFIRAGHFVLEGVRPIDDDQAIRK